MTDTDKLVAAILAGARLIAVNAAEEPSGWVAEYEKFLREIQERHQAARQAAKDKDLEDWKKLS